MPKNEKKKLLEKAKCTLSKAKVLLNDPDLDENMTFEEYLSKIETTPEEYYKYMSITTKGKSIVLKRQVKERFVNNYNTEMLRAWNANMDIQVAIDPYAVVTYMVNYINKSEDSVTKFMKEALSSNATKEAKEKLRALKSAYFAADRLEHRKQHIGYSLV